jgi:hypothetical protein
VPLADVTEVGFHRGKLTETFKHLVLDNSKKRR